MRLMWRVGFVIAGVFLGTTVLNYFVFGNTADYKWQTSRIGEWREALVREACFPAMEYPEKHPAAPQRPATSNRVAFEDYRRAVELTEALHCYLITQNNAVCERNNRAYVVDYIRKYFYKMDEMLGTAAPYGADEVRTVRELWNSAHNKAITAALENHIRNGRLIKGDFGWTVPAHLKAQLEKYVSAVDTCVKERPWVAVKL